MNKSDQDFPVQKIRTQYTEKEHTGLDELKELDRKVKRPANVFAYIFGTISAMIMGSGMSLVMTDIAEMVGIRHPASDAFRYCGGHHWYVYGNRQLSHL